MYLDTAILVKLFVREPDSAFFGALTHGQPVSSSWLAYTEVRSALLGKERTGALTNRQGQRAWAAFERNVAEELILLAPVTEAVFRRASGFLERVGARVPLRSLDALHLAACDQIQDWPLVTTDRRMRDAATLLGLPLGPLPA